ncbi:MAG: universal stress protein [Anaerolineae bacterium]|nr:universal stress protein [Anaerolineae bacterium]MDQ7037355.1 universal stress protein [Anaerolineae bacterium]
MLRHVVVPLDGSPLSELALGYAEDVTAPNGKITLVSIIETPVDYEYSLVDIPLTMVMARGYNESEYNKTYRRVHDYLLTKARSLSAKGFDVECVVESGDPATVIADIATNRKADTIVMTTHGRTGFSKWLFGSVTQKVISLMTTCPVMVVPGSIPEDSDETVQSTTTATT